MLKIDSFPPTPGSVTLTDNALDELYLSHSHLEHLLQNSDAINFHLHSVAMLGGMAADTLLNCGANPDDAAIIGTELTEQINTGPVIQKAFSRGFIRAMNAQDQGETIHEYRSHRMPLKFD